MYHHFSTPSSVDGHLGCFQVLAITNNADMNISEKMSLLSGYASFGYMPKTGIAGSCGRLIPVLLRIFILISKAAVWVGTPTRRGGVFPFIHVLSSINCHWCFWFWQFWQDQDCISEFFSFATSLGWSFPSRTFCSSGLVDMYCLNLVLSWNILFSPSILIESFAGYSSLGWHSWSLSLNRTAVQDWRLSEFPWKSQV